MLSLGVDLSERPILAVVVNEQGDVVGRGSDGSGAAAVRSAAGAHAPDRAGIAAVDAAEGFDVAGIPRALRCAPGSAAIAAEAWLGAAREARHAVCLHVGDEVYAGLIVDGKPWAGAHRRAGAAAWLALNPVERQDYRRLGSLAAEISCGGVARRLSWRIQAGDTSQVLDAAGGSLEAITCPLVFASARQGDGVAISVVRDTAKYIGMAVATFAAAIDPEIIIVSGSVAAADLMLDPVRHECARRLPAEWMNDLRVEFSTLGAEAVAIGAARLAMLTPADAA
jgi:glucokinase